MAIPSGVAEFWASRLEQVHLQTSLHGRLSLVQIASPEPLIKALFQFLWKQHALWLAWCYCWKGLNSAVKALDRISCSYGMRVRMYQSLFTVQVEAIKITAYYWQITSNTMFLLTNQLYNYHLSLKMTSTCVVKTSGMTRNSPIKTPLTKDWNDPSWNVIVDAIIVITIIF